MGPVAFALRAGDGLRPRPQGEGVGGGGLGARALWFGGDRRGLSRQVEARERGLDVIPGAAGEAMDHEAVSAIRDRKGGMAVALSLAMRGNGATAEIAGAGADASERLEDGGGGLR